MSSAALLGEPNTESERLGCAVGHDHVLDVARRERHRFLYRLSHRPSHVSPGFVAVAHGHSGGAQRLIHETGEKAGYTRSGLFCHSLAHDLERVDLIMEHGEHYRLPP